MVLRGQEKNRQNNYHMLEVMMIDNEQFLSEQMVFGVEEGEGQNVLWVFMGILGRQDRPYEFPGGRVLLFFPRVTGEDLKRQ